MNESVNLENITQTKELIEKLVLNYSDEMYSWATYRTSDKLVAEDLVQETFLAATEGIKKFKSNSSHKTWLFSILNNKIAQYHKNKIKKSDIPESEVYLEMFTDNGRWKKGKEPVEWNESESFLDDEEFHSTLKKCLKTLPETWKTALIYKYVSNNKGSEICEELNLTKTNYWQILHRAKLMMRECLEYKWFKTVQ